MHWRLTLLLNGRGLANRRLNLSLLHWRSWLMHRRLALLLDWRGLANGRLNLFLRYWRRWLMHRRLALLRRRKILWTRRRSRLIVRRCGTLRERRCRPWVHIRSNGMNLRVVDLLHLHACRRWILPGRLGSQIL